MNWLTKLTSLGAGKIMEGISGIMESHLGQKEQQLEIEKLLHNENMAFIAEATQEIESKEKILVAELQQGDGYTKRARPTIVYVGLLGAILDGIEVIPFSMPPQFWITWASVCSIWSIGRTIEKRGANGNLAKVASVITGSKILD